MFYSTQKWWRPLLWARLLTLALLLAWQVATSGALLAADAIALSEPWRFVDESKPGAPPAMGALAAVSEEAPTQVAARFNISSTMQALALQLYDNDLGGLPLSQVEELGYCTRLMDGPRPYAVTLQINIDTDVTDGDDSWQGRLVYTPSYNGAVIQGEWQCWNTLVGKWWATGGPIAEKANVDSPQPLGTLLAHFPNLGINDSYSVVALKAGDGWNYFQGEASPVVIGVEGERIDIAFGDAPQDVALDNEILLPVLLNESPPSPQGPAQNDDKKPKPDEDKDKNKDKNKDGKKDQWADFDWGNVDWANFDWNAIDWEKVDWENLQWGMFGWRGNERAEAIRAFVEDVKQCKENGWEAMGFNTPGDCVAYYVQAHTPDDMNWSDLNWGDFNWEDVEWGRDWYNRDDNNNDDNDGGRNNRTHRERRGNDD